jgi:hypothetical protein
MSFLLTPPLLRRPARLIAIIGLLAEFSLSASCQRGSVAPGSSEEGGPPRAASSVEQGEGSPPSGSALPDLPAEAGPPNTEGPAIEGPCDVANVDPAFALERIIDGLADDCQISFYTHLLDSSRTRAGPWLEDLFVTTSSDAEHIDLAGATRLREQAAVPEAVRGPDGRIWLYFGEGSLDRGIELAKSHSDWFRGHGLIGFGSLDAMVSSDGRTFQPVADFTVEGVVRGMVVDPDVVRLPDGRYRMYYVGTPIPELLVPGAWDDGKPHRVYFAESADLVHWKQAGEAARGPNADPTVLCDDRTSHCTMVSTGLDRSLSDDGGTSFGFEGHWQTDGFAPEFLRLSDARIRLFYNSKIRGGALRSAISRDGGTSFTEEGERVPGYHVEAVSFLLAAAGGWHVFYHYWQEGYSGNNWDPTQKPVTGAPPPGGSLQGSGAVQGNAAQPVGSGPQGGAPQAKAAQGGAAQGQEGSEQPPLRPKPGGGAPR